MDTPQIIRDFIFLLYYYTNIAEEIHKKLLNPKHLPAQSRFGEGRGSLKIANFKFQNWILKRVQNDSLVMPNLFRHLI